MTDPTPNPKKPEKPVKKMPSLPERPKPNVIGAPDTRKCDMWLVGAVALSMALLVLFVLMFQGA